MILFSPGCITHQTEQSTDQPCKAGSPPDSPYADPGNEYDQHRDKYSSDHFYKAVDERKQHITDTVQRASGNIDDAEKSVKPACDPQCLFADGDDFTVVNEHRHDGFTEQMDHEQHKYGKSGRKQGTWSR